MDKWKELIQLLDGHEIIQVGVKGEEELVKNCHFNLPAKDLIEVTNDMDAFISVENFFPHFANYNFPNKKGVVIFAKSDPAIYGYSQNVNMLKDKKYLRWDQFGPWECTDFIEEAFPKTTDVYNAVFSILK